MSSYIELSCSVFLIVGAHYDRVLSFFLTLTPMSENHQSSHVLQPCTLFRWVVYVLRHAGQPVARSGSHEDGWVSRPVCGEGSRTDLTLADTTCEVVSITQKTSIKYKTCAAALEL